MSEVKKGGIRAAMSEQTERDTLKSMAQRKQGADADWGHVPESKPADKLKETIAQSKAAAFIRRKRNPTSEEPERVWIWTTVPHQWHSTKTAESDVEYVRADILSSRDAEVREVLEGLRNNHGCWCPGSEEYEFKAPFVCGPHCERARALYTKLQPKQ